MHTNIRTDPDGRTLSRRSGPAAVALAALAGLLSLVAAGWSITWQVDDSRLLVTRAASQLAPLPEGLLPSNTPTPPAQPPLTVAERVRLDRGLWRDPLQPRLFNLLYADAVRTGRPVAEIDRLAGLLGRLGWRYTPAQQNLTFRAILAERFREVVDRVDSLLRRQKLPALSYALLATMEAIPQVRGAVFGKLVAHPDWRRDYLSVIAPQSGPALLDARVQTLAALLRSPGGLSREEMAPSLIALVGSGRGRAAYSLWMQRFGRRTDGDLIYDSTFQQASAVAGTPDLNIPFEWRLAQDVGHAAQVSSGGVTIDWDRRGVPMLLSQLVPVSPGGRYSLTLHGRADSGSLPTLLAPTLVCGQDSVRFEPAANARPGEARYQAGPLPGTCDMGMLTISGGLDTGSGSVTIDLTQVTLKRDT